MLSSMIECYILIFSYLLKRIYISLLILLSIYLWLSYIHIYFKHIVKQNSFNLIFAIIKIVSTTNLSVAVV